MAHTTIHAPALLIPFSIFPLSAVHKVKQQWDLHFYHPPLRSQFQTHEQFVVVGVAHLNK